MRTITTRTYTLHGGICGTAHQGFGATVPVARAVVRRGPTVGKIALEGWLNWELANDGRDLWREGRAFTADTYIEIQHTTYLVRERDDKIFSERHHVRLVDLLDLPSVAPLVDRETFSWDGEEVA